MPDGDTEREPSMSIHDKVVVITGASSGIGEAAALHLAGRGAKVVLGARGADRLAALAKRIASAGGEAVHARTGSGHFVTIASTAGLKTMPNQSVYSGTKFAVRAICEGLRQEAGETIRVTIVSPGFVNTNFTEGVTDAALRARLASARDKMAMPPDAVARAIAYALEQPDDVDVGEIVIRPTAQA